MSDMWMLHQNTRKMFYYTHFDSAPARIFVIPKKVIPEMEFDIIKYLKSFKIGHGH
jgi:hypothetical protein